MTVKDAATNSLLMFVAATCVVLIARAIPPSQQPRHAAAGSAALASSSAEVTGEQTPAMHDGVKVYYLHGNIRCETCRTIEAYAKESVQSGFADELAKGQIVWQVVNYESPGNEHYATDYETVAPNVVLVKFQNGKQVAWKGLPEVWQYTGDKIGFVNFVQSSLRDFIHGTQSNSPESPNPPPTEDSAPEEDPLTVLPLPE